MYGIFRSIYLDNNQELLFDFYLMYNEDPS